MYLWVHHIGSDLAYRLGSWELRETYNRSQLLLLELLWRAEERNQDTWFFIIRTGQHFSYPFCDHGLDERLLTTGQSLKGEDAPCSAGANRGWLWESAQFEKGSSTLVWPGVGSHRQRRGYLGVTVGSCGMKLISNMTVLRRDMRGNAIITGVDLLWGIIFLVKG